MVKYLILFLFLIGLTSCTRSQHNKENFKLIGDCEGCEAVFEYEDKKLSAVDTLPGFFEEGEKLKVSGTIYKNDGITPLEDVIIYIYHTNQHGIYAPKADSKGWEKRHGYMRGWVKTGIEGKYTFFTIKPAGYPNSTAPAHIHPVILEPDGKYYWISEYLFADDPHLGRNGMSEKPRGGTNSVLKPKKEEGITIVERNIILGRNVPGYE